MSTNQELRQESVRAVTGTTGTYNEDFLALFASAGFTTGTFNERFYLWLEDRLGVSGSGKTLGELMHDFAVDQGVADWNSLGTITLGTILQLLQGNLLLSGFAPSIAVQAGLTIAVPQGNILLSGAASTLVLSNSFAVAPSQGNIVLSGAAPTLAKSDFRIVSPAAGNIALSGFAPVINPSPSIVAGSFAHGTFTTNSSGSRTYLADYDVAAGSNRKVVAVLVIEDSGTVGRNMGTATFGGVAMWFGGAQHYTGASNHVDILAFYLDEADLPAPGTNAVIAAHIGMNEHASLTIFTMQDAPPGPLFWLTTNGTGTGTITLDATTPYANMGIVTVLGIGQGTTDAAASGTGHAISDNYDAGATAGERIIVGYLAGGAAGAHTFGYSFTAADALGIAFGLPPIGAYTPFLIDAPVATGIATAATAHAVNMPATVNAGDLLIVTLSLYWLATNPAGAITTPAGWTLPTGAKDDSNLASPGSLTCVTYVKSADGTEDGGTVDFVTDSNAVAAAYCTRIEAGTWSGTIADIEVSAAVGAGDTLERSSHDNPAVTPSWGGAGVRWLAMPNVCFADDDQAVDSIPPLYGAVVSKISGAGANAGTTNMFAWKQVIGTTEDPGSFSPVTSEYHVGHTIAIKGPGD